jgi:hypothetical protein
LKLRHFSLRSAVSDACGDHFAGSEDVSPAAQVGA